MTPQTAPHMPAPVTMRAFSCRCGRPVFFNNSQCLACNTPLGYEPDLRRLLPIQLLRSNSPNGGWRAVGPARAARQYWRCSNLNTAAACNWLVAKDDVAAGKPPLCRCCRLTRTVPDLTQPDAPLWWCRIESAKRRLVSSLMGLKLPVLSKAEDPERGLVFDLLRSPAEGPHVMTGHADGVISLDVEEADDANREARRTQFHEPYRTLLGHLRHESGHYYWQRLVEPSEWLEPFRALFGDDRLDYGTTLAAYHQNGPAPNWGQSFVSAYASSHPWEDWAETWAHYLHLADTLDTARSFGLDGERVELNYERYDPAVIADANDPRGHEFLALLNGWMELTGVLNELSRSMGVADFYPFVLSVPAVRKLHLVHRVIAAAPTLG